MSDTEKWTVDDIEILIMEVRSRPEIYNQTLPGYANGDRIEKLWNGVARHLGGKSKTERKTCSNYSSSIEKSQDSDVDHGDHPSDYNIEDTEDANILIIEESTTNDLSFTNDTCEDSFSATLKRKSPTPTTSATTYTNTNPKKSRKQGNEVNDIIAKYFTSKIENVPKHKEE
ncbi:unnamed protein product [Phaedon cochleariae]|uniref:MADF domain-containing protein n=1 Tax=Phaedon cochleariae TaxID=80249 RepID=A0A9N9SHV6_PHACE|nr:unnamed protein product [Phaedon cochleariae]